MRSISTDGARDTEAERDTGTDRRRRRQREKDREKESEIVQAIATCNIVFNRYPSSVLEERTQTETMGQADVQTWTDADYWTDRCA